MLRKCLAIGVGTVRKVAGADDGSVFPFLDGAVVAAKTIGQWAVNSGMAAADVAVLTDDRGGTVVEADLGAALDRLVPDDGTRVDHLILFFAGHGLTGDNDDITYWLLSDSLQQGYKIFVEELRRRLYTYNIGYLTIFSDACRAIADKADIRSLEPHSGANKRHGAVDPVPSIARFNACQDATSAFMIGEPGAAAPGKCLFSGVLAEALWGRVEDAFAQDRIDSSSLGRGLRTAVRARAKAYGLSLVPGGNPFFDEVVYYDRASPPLPPDPDLAPWPPPGAGAIFAGPGNETLAPGPTGFELAESDDESADSTKHGSAGDGAEPPWIGPLGVDLGAADFASPPPDIEADGAGWPVAADVLLADPTPSPTEARTARRRRRAAKVRSELRAAPPAADRIAIGGKVAAIWSAKPISWNAAGRERAVLEPCGNNLVMIEFADGLFAPVACYQDLGCRVVRDAAGVIAISFISPSADPHGGGAQIVRKALAQLQTRTLAAADADALAIKLRDGKHSNPVLGAIAAYCYDLTGDMDSIRRMAGFYRQHGQPVPYDIALLGMLDSAGGMAQVPAVARDLRRDPAQVPPWVVQAVEAGPVPVAGRCPWLRQGWDYVVSSEPEEQWLTAGLAGFAPHLQQSAFTTFDEAGGTGLAGIWGLTRYG